MLTFGQVVLAARKSCGMSREDLAAALGVRPRTVVSWESGNSLPVHAKRRALCEVLAVPPAVLAQAAAVTREDSGIPRDASRAPYPPVVGEPMLATVAGWRAEPIGVDVSDPSGPPLEAEAVGALEDLLTAERNLALTVEGQFMVPVLNSLVELVVDCLTTKRYPPEYAKRLFVVSAEANRVIGWSHSESGWDGEAQQRYLLALHAAHAAGNRPLGAHILGCLAEIELRLGTPGTATQLLSLAAEKALPAMTLTEQALLRARVALADALAGDRAAVGEGVAAAFELLARSDPAGDPPWAAWVDSAALSYRAGLAWLALRDLHSAARYLTEAMARFNAGLDRDDERQRRGRDRSYCVLALARLAYAEGEVARACELATASLDAGVQFHCGQVVAQVRAFVGGTLAAHTRSVHVRELLEALLEAELLIELQRAPA